MPDATPLIERILGQAESDNEYVRAQALEKARAMLATEGLTFLDLYRTSRRAEDTTRRLERALEKARSATTTDRYSRPSPAKRANPAGRDPEPTSESYLHRPRASLIGRIRGRYGKKRIVRNQHPPKGVLGRLRILSDEPYYRHVATGHRELVMSFETADLLYEPFKFDTEDAASLRNLRKISAGSKKMRFT